jgi:hypothetical protein
MLGRRLPHWRRCLLKHHQIRPRRPTVAGPKRRSGLVVAEQEDVALWHCRLVKPLETPLQQAPGDPLMTMDGIDGEVMKIASTAVMATQDCSENHSVLRLAHRAHTWVPSKVHRDGILRVGFVQADAFGSAPQLGHRRVVISIHRANGDVHRSRRGSARCRTNPSASGRSYRQPRTTRCTAAEGRRCL